MSTVRGADGKSYYVGKLWGDDIQDTSLNIDLSKVDWALLRKQKTWLLELTRLGGGDVQECEEAMGLIHLLDEIQDQAVEQLSEQIVYGAKSEDFEA